MEKAYNHLGTEDKIYAQWEKSGKMRAKNTSARPAFTIPLPPPNVTGNLHLGHAAMLAIEDILIRYKKMCGYEVLWVPGTDHAAIATENVVLKQLGEKSREAYSREVFLEHCKKFAAEKHDTICNQMKKMGSWLDWTREAYTFDEDRNFAVTFIFKKLYEDGLIERGYRMINWSTGAQSVLADDEVEWEEGVSPFYFIRCGEFIIGTVRSETKCADSPLVVHPSAEYVKIKSHKETFIVSRYLFDTPEKFEKVFNLILESRKDFEIIATFTGKDLEGMEFEAETYAGKRKFRVLADEIIDPEKGTGAMTISANHSVEDYELAKRRKLDAFFIEKINFEGKMNAIAGECEGMSVEVARKKSAEMMKQKGLLVGIDENYQNRIPKCYRSGCVVEPMISPQWFIMVEKAFLAPKTQKVIFARHGEKVWNEMLNDFELSEKGRVDTQNLAEKLRGRKISKVICSSMIRAIQTAEILKQLLGLECPIEIEEDFRELYSENNPMGLSFLGKVQKEDFSIVSDESFEAVSARAEKILEGLKKTDESGEVLVVGHSFLHSLIFWKNSGGGTQETDFWKFRETWDLAQGNFAEIEFLTGKQEKTTLKKILQSAVRDGHVKIIPQNFEKIYFQWIDNLRDWCISRQIWWGHRIPVWYDETGGIHLPKEQKLIFARHGETESNKNERYNRPDELLTEKGIQQAKNLAKKLKTEKISKIISSSSPRAKQTTKIVSEELGILDIEFWDEIVEMDYGDYKGKPYVRDEQGKHLNGIQLAINGMCAESGEDVLDRAKNFWEKMERVHAQGNVLVVGHGVMTSCVFAQKSGVKNNVELNNFRSKKWQAMANGDIRKTTLLQKPVGKNLRQDDDTLDTWFSSALWPFSILGWPDERNPDFQKFYPTDVLETGHDILFFWVARMILFGKYATGKFPFHTVYLHGLVTDEHGKKMSKSKGNGIDPLDMISQFGADPVRLALVIGSSPGNPIPIGTNKIKGYRNFVNKLWNAGRFVEFQTENGDKKKRDSKFCSKDKYFKSNQFNQILSESVFEVKKKNGKTLSMTQKWNVENSKPKNGLEHFDVQKIEPKSLAEKWILSRFSEVAKKVADDLENYKISSAGDAIYHFVWDEFCDWFIEASKSSPNPEFVAWLYFEILALAHPLVPFVTEEIYQNFWGENESVLNRPFPDVKFSDETAVSEFGKIQRVVMEIRRIRAEKKWNPKEKLSVSSKSGALESEAQKLIEHLAGVKFLDTEVFGEKVVVGNYEITVEIPVDENRQKSEIENLKKEISALEARLSNPNYTEKAPEYLVTETRKNLELAKEKLTKLA